MEKQPLQSGCYLACALAIPSRCTHAVMPMLFRSKVLGLARSHLRFSACSTLRHTASSELQLGAHALPMCHMA